jgi:hypothetical protein
MSPDDVKKAVSRLSDAEIQEALEDMGGAILSASLWSALAGFLVGAVAATVLTLAYFGASN